MAVYSYPGTDFFERKVRDRSFEMEGMHIHKKHELYFLEKGGTKYFIGKEIYILQPGDFIFVPKDVFHKTDKFECDSYKRVLIVFDDNFIGEEYFPYIDILSRIKFVRIAPGKQHRIREVLGRIEHESRHKSEGYETLLKLYLRELLVLLVRYQSPVTETELNSSYRLIQDCAEFISRHYNSELNLEILAKKYSLSKSYFSKLFKDITGVGVNEYINITRISAAEKLLSKKGITVTKAAVECGFNDSNYFATVFKKIKGISPKKYSMDIIKEDIF